MLFNSLYSTFLLCNDFILVSLLFFFFFKRFQLFRAKKRVIIFFIDFWEQWRSFFPQNVHPTSMIYFPSCVLEKQILSAHTLSGILKNKLFLFNFKPFHHFPSFLAFSLPFIRKRKRLYLSCFPFYLKTMSSEDVKAFEEIYNDILQMKL